MAGPWEKYQRQQPASGPWTKYQKPEVMREAAPADARPDMFHDTVASFASGAARGAADMIGLPGTVSDVGQGALQWGLRKGYQLATGAEPDPHSGSAFERFFAGPSQETQDALLFGGRNPLSGNMLRSAASAVTGGATDYQPYTTAGKFARTAGEFLPAGAAFGGNSLRALGQYVAAPAVGSEAAGQLTEGTWMEPFARVGGALLGGYAGSKLAAPTAPKLPTAQELKQSAGYGELRDAMKGAKVTQPTYQGIVSDLWKEANDFGLTTKLKSEFGGVLTDFLKRAKDSGGASLNDLELLRRSLRNAAGDKLNPATQALSARLVDRLDTAVDALSASNIAAAKDAGRPIVDALREAREVYRTGAKAQLIEDAMSRAQQTASGVENGLRIEFRKLANNPKLIRNFTPTERVAIQQVARGNFASNILRWLGTFGVPIDQGRSFLGSLSGGGVGATVGGMLGGPVGATVGGFALPAAGTAAKLGATRATQGLAIAAEELVKAGPRAQGAVAASQAARQVAGREDLLRALLQSLSAARIPYAREHEEYQAIMPPMTPAARPPISHSQ